MTGTDEPEVRVSMASGLIWEFVVPSSATTCAEEAKEMVQFCDQLYSAFGEFLVPLEISYGITKFDQDTNLRPDSNTGELVRREVRNKKGISVREFLKSTDVDGAQARWIPRVPFDRNRYRVHADGTDYAIERSECTPYRNGEPDQGKVVSDPLELAVTHRPAKNYPSVTTEYALSVSVSMFSDLWLRTSANGEKNREYLVSFLSDVSDAISAESVKRDKYKTSDFWNDLSVYSGDDDYIDLEPEAIY
ncbi:hypothetical protein AMS69_15065 [Haloarcula rubripromontorii]|uniref:Uncharacterized protein n=1 Tax=Haloarcula rubripromontorii TaxID=1705562 RepID=A0A0M9AKG0_9EURY|nr:hypothetical protein [Haloarcula rubripromontorii]KOX92655.1 hypothetical protein AMS69_15065 [Haloarcula rubripromontorii]